ncbi:hypothetical protein [Bacillus sp. V5-8f]|uniref:hypothetical protein n=1 Tax=Bacillus sp. V5-8f TaxID=2053044 RepID=UPI000C7688AA|nr:hypothetical protein [Bacillus sp. V5-8f]PLT31984.1 hypothetical protein CUU64_20575 [Bacillus sp. V5-8f]
MSSKLKEGSVVQSNKFVNGIFEDGCLLVGDYIENSISGFSNGIRDNNILRADKKYVIVYAWEVHPQFINGRKVTFYENKFIAKELQEDETFMENGEEITFSTSGVYRGSIRESDINILKVMRKVFI